MQGVSTDKIGARKSSGVLIELGLDLCKDEGYSPEIVRHFWSCVRDRIDELIGPKAPAEKPEKTKPSKQESVWCHDDDIMPWGKYEGQRLSEVPDHYWRWFLEQEWCDNWPDLKEYAECVG